MQVLASVAGFVQLEWHLLIFAVEEFLIAG
jgi:hypothetical protein